jgi:TonB family protein
MRLRLFAAIALLLPLAAQDPKLAKMTQPMILTKVEAKYTEQARLEKIEGAVTVSVVVSEEGKATDIKVTKSLGAGLDQNAIDAVKQWVFKPGTKDGVPVPVFAVIQVNFQLK